MKTPLEKYEKWRASRVKHGGYVGGKELPAHYTWRCMRDRCTKPTAKNYNIYGGRGITVCARWMEYTNFLADMGPPPPGTSLDRIDNNKGYGPDNCRWATRSEQQKNKRSTRWYTNGAFTGTLVECAAHLGISKELAHYRFKKHGTFEKDTQWQQLQSEK